MSKIGTKQIHQLALSFATASFINTGHHLFNDGSLALHEVDDAIKLQTEQFFLLYVTALSRFEHLNNEHIKEQIRRLFEGFQCL